MSKFKLINLLDKVFVAFTTFIILFAFIQFFVGDFVLSTLISAIVTFAFLALFYITKNKLANQKEIANATNQKIENYYINFSMLTQSQQLNLIKKFIPTENSPIIKNEQLVCKNQIVLIAPTAKEIDKDTFIDTIKKGFGTKKEIVVFAHSYSVETKQFAKSLNKKIVLLDKNNFYLFCKENNIQFKNNFKNIEKIKLKDIFIGFFNKKHAKGFFFSGFVLIFTSFIIPFKNYYLFFGIILLIFSLICKIKKPEKIEEFKF